METRTPHKSHKRKIFIEGFSARSYGKAFDDICDDVFSSHLPSYIPYSTYVRATDYTKLTEDDYSNIFYSQWFENTPFIKSNGEVVSEGKDNELLEIISHDSVYRPKRNIAWILGPVGTGKSSTLLKFLYHNVETLKKERRLCVRIDIDSHISSYKKQRVEPLQPAEDFVFNLINNYIAPALREFKEDGFREASEAIMNHWISNETHLKDTINLLYEKFNIRLTIILDNLDYLVYQFDRYLFLGSQKEEILKNEAIIRDYIELFSSRSLKSVIGFSFVVLSRNESEHWLMNSDTVDRVLTGSPQFSIAPVKKETIVIRHYEFLKYVFQEYAKGETSKEKVEQICDDAIDTMGERYWINRLSYTSSLSGNGLRGTVEWGWQLLLPLGYNNFISDHESWIPLARMKESTHPMPLLLMLRYRARYSQFYCAFPNLYMVNSKRQSKDIKNIKSHGVTYWLKILILLYISQRNKDGLTCSYQTIMACFSGGENTSEFSYNKDLVSVVLGSMYSSSGSGLITVTDGGQITSISTMPLTLTERGLSMVEDISECDDRYSANVRNYYSWLYIQLVIEDYDLPIPSKLIKHFKNDEVDYSYLVRYEGYIAGSDKMKLKKSHQCSIFIEILKWAYFEERNKYSATFDRLVNLGVIDGTGDCISIAQDDLLRHSPLKHLKESVITNIKDAVAEEYN